MNHATATPTTNLIAGDHGEVVEAIVRLEEECRRNRRVIERIVAVLERGSVPEASREYRAIGLILEGESVVSISRTLGISRQTLYGMPNVRRLLQAKRPSTKWGAGPRKGHRATDGTIEAYDDRDGL